MSLFYKHKAFLRKMSSSEIPSSRECDKFMRDKAHLNSVDKKGYTALMWAAVRGLEDIVSMLIKAGADVNIKNSDGYTALINAAWTGNPNIAKILIGAGADINHKNKYGTTALVSAIEYGKLDVVKLLIGAGADIDAVDNFGHTALYYALKIDKYTHRRPDIVQVLIESGADVNIKDRNGWTALMSAAHVGHSEVVETLLNAGTDINTTSGGNSTALKLAQDKGHMDIARMLSEHGATGGETSGYVGRHSAVGGYRNFVVTLPVKPPLGQLVNSNALCADCEGLAYFDAAVQSNNDQQYSQSITYFEKAIERGLDVHRAGYAHAMMGKIKLLEFEDVDEATADFVKALSFNEVLYETAHTASQYLYVFYQKAGGSTEALQYETLYGFTSSLLNYSLDPSIAQRVRKIASEVHWIYGEG